MTNWQGHKAEDSRKGVGLIEFDRDGTVVWQWNRPDIHGSLHGVLVLDGMELE